MGLFGRNMGTQRRVPHKPAASPDEQAIERYRYMLRTAPPETVEQAHAEAFAQLTTQQRQMVLQRLGEELPPAEVARTPASNPDPQSLARLATRAEIRRPGAMERMFGGVGMGMGGMGLGGMMAGSLLGSIAGTVLGSLIAHEFFDHDQGWGQEHAASDADAQEGLTEADFEPGADPGGDADIGGDFDPGGSFDI